MKKILTPAQEEILARLGDYRDLARWYLAGGTGLALRHGHRYSEDFDFFRPEPFDPLSLAAELKIALGNLTVSSSSEGTLHIESAGVRLSFLRFAPALLDPPEESGGLRIARDPDIAAMKLSAVSGRGSRKDFIDLYLLAKEGAGLGPGLPPMLDAFVRRFAGLRVERAHLLRSLSYFDDAEREPMPRMLRLWTWEEIRVYFEKEVRASLTG